jgi:hypothetical protein
MTQTEREDVVEQSARTKRRVTKTTIRATVSHSTGPEIDFGASTVTEHSYWSIEKSINTSVPLGARCSSKQHSTRSSIQYLPALQQCSTLPANSASSSTT